MWLTMKAVHSASAPECVAIAPRGQERSAAAGKTRATLPLSASYSASSSTRRCLSEARRMASLRGALLMKIYSTARNNANLTSGARQRLGLGLELHAEDALRHGRRLCHLFGRLGLGRGCRLGGRARARESKACGRVCVACHIGSLGPALKTDLVCSGPPLLFRLLARCT